MLSIFKARALYWDVIFRDSKGVIKNATIKANDEIELLTKVKRIFKHADVMDFMRV